VRIPSPEVTQAKTRLELPYSAKIEDGGFQTSPKMLIQLTGCFRPSLCVVVVVLYPASHMAPSDGAAMSLPKLDNTRLTLLGLAALAHGCSVS
jgi:hypothetical protein